MVKELPSETQVGAIGWAQDQLYQLKAQVGQLEQQLEQVQLLNTKLSESTRKVEGSLQDAVLAASLFHYGELSIKQVKDYLARNKVPVRILADQS